MRLFVSTAIATIALATAPALHAANETGSPEIIFVTGTGENAGGGAVAEAAGVLAVEADAAPSFVRAKENSAQKLDNIADRMADPDMQDGIAVMVERFAGAMMEMPIGQFAEAIEKARPGTIKRRINRDSTIADLAGKDADRLPSELGKHSRDAMGMMSGLAKAFAVMLPQFEEMAKNFEDSMDKARRK